MVSVQVLYTVEVLPEQVLKMVEGCTLGVVGEPYQNYEGGSEHGQEMKLIICRH